MDNLKYKTAIFALGGIDIGYATALLDAPEDTKKILTGMFKTGGKREKAPAQSIKHIFETIFAITAIFILSPLLIIICILIYAGSIRTAIINRKPNGLRRYDFLKFRSMVNHTEETNYKPGHSNDSKDQSDKIKNDLKIPTVARIFHRTSRDEIPQLSASSMIDIYNIGTAKAIPWKSEHNETMQPSKLSDKSSPIGSWQIFLHGNEVNMRHWVKTGIHYINNGALKNEAVLYLKTFRTALLTRGH
jgi:lipopolysaccharide/colanic/teichoic acid biosynthesis glycosyltransferase